MREQEYGSVSCGLSILTAGGAVESAVRWSPGESADRVDSTLFAEGVEDGLSPGGFGGREFVHNSVIVRGASAIGDTIEVSAGVEQQAAGGSDAGFCAGFEGKQERFSGQLTVGGRYELEYSSVVEGAANGQLATESLLFSFKASTK